MLRGRAGAGARVVVGVAVTQRLFIEGRWPSTNAVLALKASERRYPARGGEQAFSYAWWAREGRAAAMFAVRRHRLRPVEAGLMVCVWIYLLHHTRYDPDAWTLAGKWFLDGIAQAGIIRSDRTDVYKVGGRAFGTSEESEAFVGRIDDPSIPRKRAGALVELAEGTP